MINPKKLIGVKILKAEIKGIEGCDDKPFLILETDKGKFKINSWYGGYTGRSNDEYPRYISIEDIEEEG